MKTFVIETGNNEGDYILALFFQTLKADQRRYLGKLERYMKCNVETRT